MDRRLFVPMLAGMILAVATLVPVQAAPRTAAVTLNGSGSSFDAPLFSSWTARYKGARVNYQSLGSGTGQTQLNEGLTDFGAFDVPMLKTDGFSNFGKITQFPITLGGEAVTYNLPGYKKSLKLSGSVIAQIYLGHIKKWSDKRLTKLNPSLKSLNGKSEDTITVVHRSDSSGTTYIFTDFLSHTSAAWKNGAGLGPSKLPAWPVGVGGNHSTGVDAAVSGTPGAIGYVEDSYAIENHRKPAFVQNKTGRYLQPSLHGVAVDADRVSHITTTHFSVVDQPGAQSYPITGFSWAGVYTKGSGWHDGKSVCKATVKFFNWSRAAGQSGVNKSPLFYVKLPKNIAAYAASQLHKVKCNK